MGRRQTYSFAKADATSKQQLAINTAHHLNTTNAPQSILQKSRHTSYALTTILRRACQSLTANPHVRFCHQSQVCYYNPATNVPMIT
jgi:hypothetical protein